MVFVSLDVRTGLISLRDTGDLGVAGRAPRFASITDRLNETPTFLLEALVRLRLNVGIYSPIMMYTCLLPNADHRRYRRTESQLHGPTNLQGTQSGGHG